MRKLLRINIGMLVCVLGVLSTSSCSKDEFFGLEGSEYIDNSLKTEIAMSQEFADYLIACIELSNNLSQPVDTAKMQQYVVGGKPIYCISDSQESMLVLLDNLKNAYPELTKADRLDFVEIEKIAISKNKLLKGYFPRGFSKTDGSNLGNKQSRSWIYAASEGSSYEDASYQDNTGSWGFKAFDYSIQAISMSIWFVAEGSSEPYGVGAGLIFDDNSGVSMVGYGECWPSAINSISPSAEADFLIVSPQIIHTEFYEFFKNLGSGYYESGRQHLVYPVG